MGNYYLLRDGLITDSTKYGVSIPGVEKTNNTTAYTLTTSDSWSTALTGVSGDVIDSIAVHLSSRAATPVGTLSLSVSSRTVSPTVVGTYPVSSFTSYDGSNNTVATYPLNWQLLKLSTPFTNSGGTFKINLKTSDADQLSLMGTSTVNGVDYDRMAISDSTAFKNSLIKSNVQILNNSPFINGSETTSAYLSGTNTGITTGRVMNCGFGTELFTIEGWFYLESGNVDFTNLICYNNSGSTTGWGFAYRSTGLFMFWSNNVYYGNVPITINTWNHIAVVKDTVGTNVKIYINGVLSATVSVPTILSTNICALTLGRWEPPSRNLKGYISNVRIVRGKAMYTGDFTPTNLEPYYDTTAYTVFLYKAPYSNYYLYTDKISDNNIHIGSTLSGFTTQNRTITVDNTAVGNVYVHKGGTLKFPDTSTTLSAIGTNGLQATSEGTIQVGSSASPVPSDVTHQIILSGNHIGVSNGGRLDVYGAHKLPYAKIDGDITAGDTVFYGWNNNNVTDFSSWQGGDKVVILPNTTASNTTEVITLTDVASWRCFFTPAAAFSHPSIGYLPTVANLTRNVKIGGLSNTNKGNIQAKGAAIVNVRNTEFKNIDGSLSTGVNSSGLFSVSGCTLSGNGIETILTPIGTAFSNVNINNNVLFRTQYGIYLNNLTSDNNTISNNLILSSKSAGIYIKDGLKGNPIFNNNMSVGPSPYGTYIENNTTGNTLSGIVNFNNTYGMVVSSGHAGRIHNVTNTYNTRDGIYVDGTISQLNETTFSNITASNNKTLGFRVSGNPIDHLSPVIININRLVANDNLSGGFEGYCIAGNLSSIELNRNGFYGMKTSIGNYNTTFDGITALMNDVASTSAAIGILSGICYYPILIKDANVGKLISSSTFGAGISLDSTKFSEFSVDNSTVKGGSSDFQLRITKNILEGSYLISNTNVGVLPVGVGISTTNYQSDVLKTTGFAFTNMNNITGYHVTYLAAGNRSIDSTTTCNINQTTSPSERLTPQSNSLKLRSGSKFVALNAGESTAINVYVRKSTLATNGVAYNGTAPRLILKRNGAMGINSDILMDQLDTTSENFLKLAGVTPAVTDAGVLEFYIDCDGTQGWINIDNWTAN